MGVDHTCAQPGGPSWKLVGPVSLFAEADALAPRWGGTCPSPIGCRAQTSRRRRLLASGHVSGLSELGAGGREFWEGPEPAEPAAKLHANGHQQHGPAVLRLCPRHAQGHGSLLQARPRPGEDSRARAGLRPEPVLGLGSWGMGGELPYSSMAAWLLHGCGRVSGSLLGSQQTCNERLLVQGQRVVKELLPCLVLMCNPAPAHHTHTHTRGTHSYRHSYGLSTHPAIYTKHTLTHLQTNTPRCTQM